MDAQTNKLDLFKKLQNMGNTFPVSIAICNDKGGCNKTTTAINLAEAISRIDFNEHDSDGKYLKVVLIDGDEARTCSMWAKKRELNNDEERFIVANEKKAAGVIMNTQPDILIYDTAGGIKSNEILELCELANYFILPTKPDSFDQHGTINIGDWMLDHNKPFKVLISDAHPAGNFSRGRNTKKAMDYVNIPYFEDFIKSSSIVKNANDAGKTVFHMSGARDLQDIYIKIALETLTAIVNGKSK